jgi:KDPG and KHG aldolase
MRADCPPGDPTIVAILRGLTPARAADVARVLHRAGIRIIEVPLNSPEPFASIGILAALQLTDCLIGAGTVLGAQEVERTHAAGARLVVAPNCDPPVIRAALTLGMRVMPGVASATEAFQAIAAGASELKLFPGQQLRPGASAGTQERAAGIGARMAGRRHWRRRHPDMAGGGRRRLRLRAVSSRVQPGADRCPRSAPDARAGRRGRTTMMNCEEMP